METKVIEKMLKITSRKRILEKDKFMKKVADECGCSVEYVKALQKKIDNALTPKEWQNCKNATPQQAGNGY